MLVNANRTDQKTLTKEFKEANLIFTSGSTTLTRPMMNQLEKGPYLFSTGRESRYLNVTDISLKNKTDPIINISFLEASQQYNQRKLDRLQDTFPDQTLEEAYKGQENILRPRMMHWELIPNWVRNQKELNESRKKYTTLNIKSEGIFQNKVAQALVHTNRCLVLASHFFEWQEVNKEKFPYCIQLINQELFYIAGVWNTWTDHTSGEVKNSFGIITTEANEFMAKIHNVKKRMPTILNDELATAWVSSELTTNEIQSIAGTKIDSIQLNNIKFIQNFKIFDYYKFYYYYNII